MSELASVIAHELDQPLTAILSNAQATRHLLALPQPDLAESHAALDDIIADTMRASQIVQRERRLLRKGQGAIELLDLNEIVSEIELFIRADARQQRCTCALDLAHGPLQVRADRVQLQQVLINLSRNGIQAMSDQPRDRRAMHIRTRGEGDEVLLEVADCGPGAGEESLERLFEPFFTTKPGGLGMGLAISRAIIQAHHGRIWATRNDAAGLTFHIALARARETQHGGR
jgi:C4-dicarboxylate-specific signal transduction histidine kinase